MANKSATSNDLIKERNNCRVCDLEGLVPILSLGNQNVVNFTDEPNAKTYSAPLDLVLCPEDQGGCGLLQMKHTFDHDVLYKKYWYRSGISATMVNALNNVATTSEKIAGLKSGDIVVDIGSNDGTLLRQYETQGIQRVGFEPSNLWELGSKDTDTVVINDYFNHASFKENIGDDKRAKLITAVAMFYDLEDPNAFVDDIKQTLDDEGLFVIQQNYLGLMLEGNTYDNISHEHLEYYSLLSLENLLRRHDFEVMDVELNDVNGGSFRTYIKNKGSNVKPHNGAKQRLDSLREEEKSKGFESVQVYRDFASRIEHEKDKLTEYLRKEREEGRSTYVFGASTRGLVVLQYCGIDNQLIDGATDKNPDKDGKYIVGTGIKIESLEKYKQHYPDNLLVLPYQFAKEIVNQEHEFLEQGGKMIFALPNFKIVDKYNQGEILG